MPNPEQQVPVTPTPTQDFDFVNRAMELDSLGGAKATPEDPLGLESATDKANETLRVMRQFMGDSYDLSDYNEKQVTFDLLYSLSDTDREKLIEDPERSQALQNAIFFGGAGEIRDAAREVFGKNQKRLDSFMSENFPDFEDVVDDPSDIIQLVKQEEALRLKPYKDIAGHWTIGWGHKLEGNELNRFKEGITKDQADSMFQDDWDMARANAQDVYARAGYEWESLDKNRRDMLTEMAFNVGPGGLARYKSLLRAIESDDYKEMAKYHRRFAKDAKTGEWTDMHRNQKMFDRFIKPNISEEDMVEIEAHWAQKNRKLGIQTSRPVKKIREGGQQTHTLGRGQTLSAVGRKYGMPVKTIMEANPDIKNRHKIKAGDTLIIPKKEKK